ncbi:uracil-DNA glycosylase family protein [Halopenitus persicus]|uniref:uracil-DNA glycosylase family protein n=1 Tax=Halopenitus persicus TaxID=1048396 RepID=UPI000B8949CF|nr:uracil-DNA glycosylase family protein [Halopenitus persicus]
MSLDNIPAFFEETWNNWNTGAGPCFECPNRDSQCRFYPKFGEGVLDAEIAFVAETPNEDRKTQNSPKSQKERDGQFESKVRNNPIPEWIKEGNRFSDSFFKDISADFSDERKLGIYFTNIKKCADIEGRRKKWKNRKAKLHCEQYLKDELRTVSPEIVVTFGEEATESLFEVFDSASSFSRMKDDVLEVHHVSSYNVIPSFHWSYLHLNLPDQIEDQEEYWTTLAEIINSTVDS